MEALALQYGYFGVFAISLIGATSIIIPVPYVLAIYFLGHLMDPLLIAVSSGLGSALGEFSGYVLGYYGRKAISEQRRRKVDFWLRIFDRHGSIIVFLFALSPLPDDLLFIPLGIARYSFVKAFIPCLAGKIIMSYLIAQAGSMSLGIVEQLFGEGGWLGTIAFAVLLVIVVTALLKVDWEQIFTKYFEKKTGESVTAP